MGKKKGQRPAAAAAASSADKPATLKDLLGAGTIAKLKAQAEELKKEEEERKTKARIQAEEVRRAEQKRLDNDFEHLLNTSEMNWHKFK